MYLVEATGCLLSCPILTVTVGWALSDNWRIGCFSESSGNDLEWCLPWKRPKIKFNTYLTPLHVKYDILMTCLLFPRVIDRHFFYSHENWV